MTDFWSVWLAVMKDTSCNISLQSYSLFWPTELQANDQTELWSSCLGLGRQKHQSFETLNSQPLSGCQADTCTHASSIKGKHSQTPNRSKTNTNLGAIKPWLSNLATCCLVFIYISHKTLSTGFRNCVHYCQVPESFLHKVLILITNYINVSKLS